MDRPSKRPRLSTATKPGSATDDIDLQAARAKNDLNLKSIFEGIFAKYENDFTEVGDEIDLETGELVVNNGHIGLIADPSVWGPELGGAEVDGEETYGSRTDADASDLEDGVHADGGASETADPTPETPTISQLFDDNNKVADSTWDFPAFGNEKKKAVDPIWSFPDFGPKPSTPTSKKQPIYPTPSYDTIRTASPPGAPDIWALPKPRGRPSTGGVKKYKETGLTKKKRDHRPSAVTSDWSFAEISEGNESDDPLNDGQDYQQSPTPKGVVNLRGGRPKPPTQSRGEDHCTYCKQSFRRPDYISHLERVILSNDPDEEHDITEARLELAAVNDSFHLDRTLSPNPDEHGFAAGEVANTNSAINNTDYGHDIAEVEEDSAASDGSNNTEDAHNDIEAEKEKPATNAIFDDTDDEQNAADAEMDLVAVNVPTYVPKPTIVITSKRHDPPSTNTPIPKPDEKSPEALNSTRPRGRRGRKIITPDDAKLIIRLRQLEQLQWKEVVNYFPGKSVSWLYSWNRWHWAERQKNPPLSRPWSPAEREKLDHLEVQDGISWEDIRGLLPGRWHTEIEYELLRRWAKQYIAPNKDRLPREQDLSGKAL